MITIADAVATSKKVITEIMPEYAALDPEVEEFRHSRDEWVITFRAKNPDPVEASRGLGSIFYPFIDKVVSVSSSDGSLLSIQNPGNGY